MDLLGLIAIRFNLVNHQHHGTDPAKYGVKKPENEFEVDKTDL